MSRLTAEEGEVMLKEMLKSNPKLRKLFEKSKEKVPTISLTWLKKEHNAQLNEIKNCVDKNTFNFIELVLRDIIIDAKEEACQ